MPPDKYKALQQAEMEGEKDLWIRTKSQPKGGSSAFGPAQVTRGKALDYAGLDPKGRKKAVISKDSVKFVKDVLTPMQDTMLKYGGEDMQPGYEDYDYGGTGKFDKDKYAPAYNQMTEEMIDYDWKQAGGDVDAFLKLWRGKTPEKRYKDAFMKSLNGDKKPESHKPAIPKQGRMDELKDMLNIFEIPPADAAVSKNGRLDDLQLIHDNTPLFTTAIPTKNSITNDAISNDKQAIPVPIWGFPYQAVDKDFFNKVNSIPSSNDFIFQTPTWYGIPVKDDEYKTKNTNVLRISRNSFFGKILSSYERWTQTDSGKRLTSEQNTENVRNVAGLFLLAGIGVNAVSLAAQSPIGQNFLNRTMSNPLFQRFFSRHVSSAEMNEIFRKAQPGGKALYGAFTKDQNKIWDSFQNASRYISTVNARKFGIRISPTRGAELVLPKSLRLLSPKNTIINFYAGMPVNFQKGDIVNFGNQVHKILGIQGDIVLLVNMIGNTQNVHIDDITTMVSDASVHELFLPKTQSIFPDTQVVDETGKPKVVYSGHSNTELYQTFDPKKSTAGAFYATENPEIASNYALGKMGNMEHYEGGNQYRFLDKHGKFNKKISALRLTEKQFKVLQQIKHQKDGNGDYKYEIAEMDRWIKQNKDYDKDAANMFYTGGSNNLQNVYRWYDMMGYTIAYPEHDTFITPKMETLPNNPEEYIQNKIYHKTGLYIQHDKLAQHEDYDTFRNEYIKKMDSARPKAYFERQKKNSFEILLDRLGIEWNSYQWHQPGVMQVYLNIKHPLVTSEPLPDIVMQKLKQAAGRERKASGEHWTKDYSLKQFVQDIEEGNEFWATQVPLKAKTIFQQMGYDGIKDVGGKMGDDQHIVWIAFEPEQIQNAIGRISTQEIKELLPDEWEGTPAIFEKFHRPQETDETLLKEISDYTSDAQVGGEIYGDHLRAKSGNLQSVQDAGGPKASQEIIAKALKNLKDGKKIPVAAQRMIDEWRGMHGMDIPPPPDKPTAVSPGPEEEPDKDLIEESKKFNSAEEFVNSKEIRNFKDTNDKAFNQYVKTVYKNFDLEKDELLKKLKEFDNDIIDIELGGSYGKGIPNAESDIDYNIFYKGDKDFETLADELRPLSTKNGLVDIVIKKPSDSMSKTQLTDIYNKAHAKPQNTRQQIRILQKYKGMSNAELDRISKRLTSKKSFAKTLTEEELRKVYKSVQIVRPKTINGRKVISKVTENRIATLKKNLIAKNEMTEEYYKEILNSVNAKEPFYESGKHFISEEKGKEILKRMQEFKPLVNMIIENAQAVSKNLDVKVLYDKLAQVKGDGNNIKVSGLLDAQHFFDGVEEQSGLPFGQLFRSIVEQSKQTGKEVFDNYSKVLDIVQKQPEILTDDASWTRIENYLASDLPDYYTNKPKKPEDITEQEKALAEEFRRQFKEKEVVIRFLRWQERKKKGALIPGAPEKELREADKIYETQGLDAVKEYLKDKTWGVIKTGYTPLETFLGTRTRRFRKLQVGAKGIRSRGKEYKESQRNLLQRYASYMKKVSMQYELAPLVDSLEALWESNMDVFRDPQEMTRLKNNVLKEVLHLVEYDSGILMKVVSNVYAQMARTLFLGLGKGFRNLFQNPSFYTDWKELVSSGALQGADLEYFEQYVRQDKSILHDFLLSDKGFNLPGLRTLNKWADAINMMGRTDTINRYIAFAGKLNAVRNAFNNNTDINDVLKAIHFSDLTKMEQKRMLLELAKNGQQTFERGVARIMTERIHFKYERLQRAPESQGSEIAHVLSNLLVFQRGYLQRGYFEGKKLLDKDATPEQKQRAARNLFHMTAIAYIMGLLWMKATGKKQNPYDPLRMISLGGLGGLYTGGQEQASELSYNTMRAMQGDKKAQGKLPYLLSKVGDNFIPFYKEVFDTLDAIADRASLDRRWIKGMIGHLVKEYKHRKIQKRQHRTLIEKFQKALFGAKK